MVLFDFLLVITWFPACVVFHEKHIKRNCCPSASPQSLFKACRSKLCCKPKPSSSSENEENEEEEDAQTKGRHWLEEFYGGPYADFVINHRKGIVGFFLFLGVVSTYGWVMYLKPSTKPFSFFDGALEEKKLKKNEYVVTSCVGEPTLFCACVSPSSVMGAQV
jgi:hypothetical protein